MRQRAEPTEALSFMKLGNSAQAHVLIMTVMLTLEAGQLIEPSIPQHAVGDERLVNTGAGRGHVLKWRWMLHQDFLEGLQLWVGSVLSVRIDWESSEYQSLRHCLIRLRDTERRCWSPTHSNIARCCSASNFQTATGRTSGDRSCRYPSQ